MSTNELYRRTATDVVGLLKRGEVTPLELIDVAAARIAATDGAINAVPTLCLERARDHAKRLMASGEDTLLGGLPIAVKDLNEVEGVRCTHGSPIFADHIPERSDLMVETLEARGAIVIGKSNTPEFGAGASTFNEVLGKTRNPWNTAKSVAGSSGGAAAALAAGQVWLATGSDLGGSLRTPASFNAVIGLRPSPGRVPHGPSDQAFNTMSVNGPMGRTVADTALFLDAMAVQHPEDPISLAAPAQSFVDSVAACPPPRRVGFSPNLGIVPVDPEVVSICEQAAQHFAAAGAEVVEACPDFSEAIDAFQIIRAQSFATGMAGHLRDHYDLLKPEVIWNIEKGLALTADEIAWAELARGRLYHNTVRFFADHDLLLCPAAIVPPFDVDVRYIDNVNGETFDNYVHWISITFAVTLTSCPAVSAPAGFTVSGLPVGLQIVGPPRGEVRTLAAAALLEEATDISSQLPIDPREP
ncbi:MAG: amidase family protein [Pseudomonadota bacterium]|nr:amidase family protein [Pseudomonadota bacterium]